MGDKKKARTGKNQKRTWWNSYVWLMVGIVSTLVVLGAILLVCGLNSFGIMDVSFSAKSGFYSEDLSVSIEPEGFLLLNKPAVKYNMNGDDLDDSGDWYSAPIKLEVPEEGYKLYTITAFTCRAYNDCTFPKTATYVLGKNLNEDVTIDIININSPQKSLYDYETGIMVGGRTYDDNSSLNIGGFIGGNYSNRGRDWMREAYITRFDRVGDLVWDQDVYIGISGGSSATYDVKSLKVSMQMANEEDEGIKTIRLRSGSQDQFSGNIRSSVVDRLAEECDFDGRAGTRRTVVFLNGEYYGIFDMQNTFSEQNLMRMFGLTKKKDIEKNRGSEKNVFDSFRINGEVWKDLDSNEGREQLEELIDMDDYLKYYSLMILVNNTDWPMNNYEAWRYNGKYDNNNKYSDGRIRFLTRDTDLVYYTEGNTNWFDGAIGDIFVDLMENKHNGDGSSFSKVMMSDYYRQRFINMMKEWLEGPFKTENVLKIIDEEAEMIEHQVKLFSTEEEYEEWTRQIGLLKKAASEREGRLKADIQKYFGVKL